MSSDPGHLILTISTLRGAILVADVLLRQRKGLVRQTVCSIQLQSCSPVIVRESSRDCCMAVVQRISRVYLPHADNNISIGKLHFGPSRGEHGDGRTDNRLYFTIA